MRLGPSGSGKSRATLDLLAHGATLVSDDQVHVEPRDGVLVARAPDPLRGLLEVRGAGLLRVATIPEARLILAVDLAARTEARLPPLRQFCITDLCVPLIAGENLPNLVSLVMACLRYGDEPLIRDPDT